MLGNITLVKSLILPKITYVSFQTEINKQYLTKYHNKIYSCRLNNKAETVSKKYQILN